MKGGVTPLDLPAHHRPAHGETPPSASLEHPDRFRADGLFDAFSPH